MERKKRNYKKELRQRLSLIMLIYLDGLNEMKKERLSIYLHKKMSNVVDYYVLLVKRKERKNLVLHQVITDIECSKLCNRENGKKR